MPNSDPFVHLHVHTEYSTLDGAVRTKQLMRKAMELEMPAVALTDHGNLFGAIEFYQQGKAHGVKPIIGCEVYMAPGPRTEQKPDAFGRTAYHLTLLSQNATGYYNLLKLVSAAHLEGFYYKPRIDKEILAAHSDGLICLSGCLLGEVNQAILNEQTDLARRRIGEYVDIFGTDRFFLEVQDHDMEAQRKCTRQMSEFGREFGLGLVAANDVHFLERDDHEAHDVMICIGTGCTVNDENRLHYSTEVYFKSPEEMAQLFAEIPEALSNTLRIAEMCDLELELDPTSSEKYPTYSPPEGKSEDDYLRALCYEGLERRYGTERVKDDPELKERLEHELGVLQQMGFTSYFLIVWDFIHWAKEHGVPVGPGRGSAAGSLVAYVLGITDLCPLRFGLIFERFLNPERVSPPDIDIDFCQTRRGEVIEYVRQKYGERAVSHIITFQTLGAKSVVRDVARVMGLSYGDGDRIAKMIPPDLGMTLEKAEKMNPELAAAIESEPTTQELWGHALFLEGLTRGPGVHAAGIVIADRELDEYVPLTRDNLNRDNNGQVVTQYAMGPLTDLGMLKMDFLGLKTLTVIQDAVTLIRRHTPDFDIEAVSFDDQPTFDLLNRGETCGVFQLESGGMVSLCKQFGVNSIEDIIALIALYRPGPMELIPDFIKRKKGETEVTYLHPLLEEVSRETHGILIYQEQVQKAANLLAGYSLGDADILRRAMGKKKKAEMERQEIRFVEGCGEFNNIPKKHATDIFKLLKKFADYGFNKSHSAAYGLISYRTAHLKANHPLEFMAALLSNEINNTDKIAIFVAECKRMGIEILPPDVNYSHLKFIPEKAVTNGNGNGRRPRRAIRFGLAAIKNVGEGAMAEAIKERDRNGQFESLEDFSNRLDSRTVNRKILESLVKCGAFDFCAESRRSMCGRLEQVVASSAALQRDRASGQASLFETSELTSAPAPSSRGDAAEFTKTECLAFEKELLGFYVTGHPLDDYRFAIYRGRCRFLAELEKLAHRQKYKFAGFVESVDVRYTKKDNKPFAILTLEDLTGSAELFIWTEAYENCARHLVPGSVLKVGAQVDVRGDQRRLSAVEIAPLKKLEGKAPASFNPAARLLVGGGETIPEASQPAEAVEGPGELEPCVRLHLDCLTANPRDLREIRDILRLHPGTIPVQIRFSNARGNGGVVVAGEGFRVTRNRDLLEKLSPWLDG